jgi:Uma2 family endonuclease
VDMGGPSKAVAYIEMEDYLALENASRYKHEYLGGVIYAIQGEPVRGMAGGSQTHSRIIRNAGYALHGKLQGSPCEALSTEMRLRIAAADAVFYPDVLVHCQLVANPATTMELTDARLVIEVLSPTTQHFDRGDKLRAYQRLAGLQHIILLSSMEQAAWACHRVPADAEWTDLLPWPRGTRLPLDGLGVDLGWDEVYAGVGLG